MHHYQTERHLAEELHRQRMAREATYAYNSSQYIVAALQQTGRITLDSEVVEAQSLLVHAHRKIEGVMRRLEESLEPKPEGRRKGKPRGGEIIDVQACPDPFSEALADLPYG